MADPHPTEIRQTDPRRNVGIDVVLRPIATPLSLSFVALAAATFVVAGLELGWVPASESVDVGLVCLVFTAPLQLLGVVFGFLSRDPVATTGVGTLAGTWLTVGVVLATRPPGTTTPVLGLLLCASAAILLVIPTVVAAETKAVAGLVMGASAVRFAITAGYELSGDHAVETAAGVMGLVLAVVALYGALAFELEGARNRTQLPTLRRGRGLDAMTQALSDDVAEIQHEAGVRPQL